MDTEASQIPRKLFIGFTDGTEEHVMDTDITGMDAEEIQAAAEMLTDEMLMHVGLLEVARHEESEDE